MHRWIAILVAFVVVVYHPRAETYEEDQEEEPQGRSLNSPGVIARPPQTPAETQLVERATRLIKEFVDHLRQKYGGDPRARQLFQTWRGPVRILSGPRAPGGRFSPLDGSMGLNPKIPDNANDARLRSKLLHELAHSSRDGHGVRWRDTWLWFLNIATGDLGWTCALTSDGCRKYSVCDTQDCPKCTFVGPDMSCIVGNPNNEFTTRVWDARRNKWVCPPRFRDTLCYDDRQCERRGHPYRPDSSYKVSHRPK